MSNVNLPYEETHKMQMSAGTSPEMSRRVRWIKGIAWTSVFAGVAVALGIQMLLSMLGTGIGMSAIDPLRAGGTPSASAFSIGAGLWWVISSLIALFAGGWVAAQFSGYLRHLDGLLHGLLVWALTTLITMYLLGSAIGSVASGVGNVVAAGARGMAETASATVLWDDIKRDANALFIQQQGVPGAIDPRTGLPYSAKTRTTVIDPEFNMVLERFLTAKDNTIKENNRTALINLLTVRTGMSVDEAVNRVNSWERSYDQAELKAREAADKTAKAISWAAIWGFIVVLVSAIAAALGGYLGTPVPDREVRGRQQPVSAQKL